MYITKKEVEDIYNSFKRFETDEKLLNIINDDKLNPNIKPDKIYKRKAEILKEILSEVLDCCTFEEFMNGKAVLDNKNFERIYTIFCFLGFKYDLEDSNEFSCILQAKYDFIRPFLHYIDSASPYKYVFLYLPNPVYPLSNDCDTFRVRDILKYKLTLIYNELVKNDGLEGKQVVNKLADNKIFQEVYEYLKH